MLNKTQSLFDQAIVRFACPLQQQRTPQLVILFIFFSETRSHACQDVREMHALRLRGFVQQTGFYTSFAVPVIAVH